MTRRTALAALTANACWATEDPSLFGPATGVAVAVEFQSRKLLTSHRLGNAGSLLLAPGSVLKPLVLASLVENGKLSSGETHACTGRLRIGSHALACVHPRGLPPFDVPSAIAYSCNEFIANAAARCASGELSRILAGFGLASRTPWGQSNESQGRIESAGPGSETQLQALGEDHISVTALGVASAYHRLASRLTSDRTDKHEAILQGLEGAVEYGTAQRAAVNGVRVAGKTGSAPHGWAWFAGFAPSRAPRVVVAVAVQGYSGGADAAPIAQRMFAAHVRGAA